MNQILWTSISLVLVLEGIGPMLFPKIWKNIITSMSDLPNSKLRRYGGSLVIAGIVIYFMIKHKYYI